MLKDHNVPAYEDTKAMLLEHRECCLVAATGIGKSNIATEIIQEFKLNTLVIAPKTTIRDEWSNMPEKYGFDPTISTVTYQYFTKHYKKLYGFDMYIFDEAHHTDAKVWGEVIRAFRENLTTEFVLGLTADPKRYSEKVKLKRNVVDSVFNGHVVYGLNHKDAVDKGVLPSATYVCALYDSKDQFDAYKKKLKTLDEDEISNELRGRLAYTRRNCEAIEDIIRKHAPTKAPVKGIIFVDSINNIDMGVLLARRSFPKEATYYIHSKLSQRENAETLDMFKKAKSGFIVVVDMLNEGLHIEGVNIIIMLRKTCSPTIYVQQIGRGLAAHGQNVTIYDLVRNDTSIKKVLSRFDDIEDEIGDIEEECEDNKRPEGRTRKVSSQSIIYDYATDVLNVFEEIDKYGKNKRNRPWSSKEDEILREFYPTMGKRCVEKLPGRSINQCLYRANVLNIRSNNYGTRWTKHEDDILREYYPTIGSQVSEKLNNRNPDACVARANSLGLVYIKNYWTEWEDNIIKESYPSIGVKVSKMLNNRSEEACKARAKFLGVYFVRKDIWTEYEDSIIRKYYPILGSDITDLLPNRTIEACKSRAFKLNVPSKIVWTEEEDNIIRDNYPIIGVRVCRLLPNRTMDACIARAHELNVHSNYKWTEDEDNILREYYPIMGKNAYVKLPGRTAFSCKARARMLNIKRDQSWTTEEDNILRKYYPTIGHRVSELLPSRTKGACKCRAAKLGLSKIE